MDVTQLFDLNLFKTINIFSILYYACCVGLTPSLNKKVLGTIESLHYRALHLIICDYRQKISREVITWRTKCLPPDKWSKFALASLFLNMYGCNEPLNLLEQMTVNTYVKRRWLEFVYSFDSARSKVEKQMTRNWLGSAINEFSSPWSDRNLSKDSVRVFLKKMFYKDY